MKTYVTLRLSCLSKKDDQQEVLNEFASAGWRLVTAFPVNANGTTMYINAIMERDA